MEAQMSVEDREGLALQLLASLPRSRLALVQQQITPLLQFDIVGTLPAELALQVLTHLPAPTLLLCGLVNKQWQRLANDQSLWKTLCASRGWSWRTPPNTSQPPRGNRRLRRRREYDSRWDHSDDEGIGDSDSDYEPEPSAPALTVDSVEEAKAELTQMHVELDTMAIQSSLGLKNKASQRSRHSAPVGFNAASEPGSARRKPDYKLLHQTHVRLRNRFLTQSYRLSPLQTKGSLNNGGHTSTVYCLQLYTYPDTGRQVLFTGSRDRTIREWNLGTRMVDRVISGVHTSSVLSICVGDGYLASAGSDKRVGLWNVNTNELVKVLSDHEDSVLCVRFNEEYLVSCSKDRTVRVYSFPDLDPLFVLDEHRAAVNTVSLSGSYICTGSGDRSIRLWSAKTGKCLRTFDNHHSRGIASIDLKPPIVISGSSDKHIRLFDVTTLQGWSTSPDHINPPPHQAKKLLPPLPFPPAPTPNHDYDMGGPGGSMCPSCGQSAGGHGGAPPSSATPVGLPSLGSQAAGMMQHTNSWLQTVTEPLSPNHPIFHNPPSNMSVTSSRPTSSVAPWHHNGLVRSVLLNDDFVISGSYDLSVKVWDRMSGMLIADLTGPHTGRVFCVAADYTKIVSCGEDQTICIWDFSHGIDTSFVQLC